jgi:hypothetical protein
MPAKKKTTKKTTGKTQKMKNLSQTHGKVEKFEPSTLEQIWGSDGLDPYTTLEEEEYLEQLNGMAKVDMQAHATKVGIVPIDNMDILNARLVKQFKSHVAAYRKPITLTKNDPKMTKELRNILGEGK